MDLNELHTWAFVLWAGFSAFIACISIGLAIWNISNNRRLAREQSTLEFINQYTNDAAIGNGLSIIRGAQKLSVTELRQYVDKIMGNRKTRVQVLALLNKFEVLAAGLKQNIYDQEIIHDVFAHDICVVFELSKPFIHYIRDEDEDKDSKAFIEYEKLYTTWPAHHMIGA